MVAQITEGTAFDKHGRPFRRRNPRPAIVVLVFLVLVTGVAWTVTLTRPAKVREVDSLQPAPAAADRIGTGPNRRADVAQCDDRRRRPPNSATPRSASSTPAASGGQAADVAGAMKDLGFAQPTAANDPIYAGTRLTCQGQIRFGTAGQATAAAVWLVAPCTELFNDNRADDSVDLAVGTEFSGLAHNDDIDAVLASLRPGATGPSDPSLLSKIHASTC